MAKNTGRGTTWGGQFPVGPTDDPRNYRARGGAMAEQETDAMRGLLTRLEDAREAATPGVWKLWGMSVHADVDGTSNLDTSVPVAHTAYRDENGKPRTWDASLICEMHRALPSLTAAVRAVLDLADSHAGCCQYVAVDRLRAAVAEALEVR